MVSSIVPTSVPIPLNSPSPERLWPLRIFCVYVPTKFSIVAISVVVTEPAPVNVTSPEPWNVKSEPETVPVDVSRVIGGREILSHEGDNSTTAFVIASPEN